MINKISISPEFNKILEDIEVSESKYEEIDQSYQSISRWIQREESIVKKYDPEIFIQGSVKIGTAIKPITEEGSYDIDIVCNFNKLDKDSITQAKLKEYLGIEIKKYTKSQSMINSPKDGKRCWTITYSDDANFHIDILPSILDTKTYKSILNESGIKNSLYEASGIAITDKSHPQYHQYTNNWEVSNPKGYFEWFRSVSQYQTYREFTAKSLNENVENIPSYKIKTPLQRIIQILKRHAEINFEKNAEFKPSSIIITTLAAKAHDTITAPQMDLLNLLTNIVQEMPKNVDYIDDKPCVLNPVNPKENLSLKWSEDSKYYNEFLRWLGVLMRDFNINKNQLYSFRNKLGLQDDIELPSISLNNLPHHKAPKWPIRSTQNVKIFAKYFKNGFRWQDFKNGDAINKGCKLRFEISTPNVKSYEIYWQVTNTGSDAQDANSLRGGFYESTLVEGKRIRKEETLYIGQHFVEAFIVKNGVCYGKSEPFVVNIVKQFVI